MVRQPSCSFACSSSVNFGSWAKACQYLRAALALEPASAADAAWIPRETRNVRAMNEARSMSSSPETEEKKRGIARTQSSKSACSGAEVLNEVWADSGHTN